LQVPAECPTTLQSTDRWFTGGDDFPIRPLYELINAYHNTAGRNCKMLIDLAVNRDGLVPARHAARYAQLGSFISGCYGAALPSSAFHCDNSTGWTLCSINFTQPTFVDRLLLQEDLRHGQRVRQWDVDGLSWWGDSHNAWLSVDGAYGQSIGNKRIALFGESLLFLALRVNIRQAAAEVKLRTMTAHNCQDDY
jgi:alpha-L-fucosidase